MLVEYAAARVDQEGLEIFRLFIKFGGTNGNYSKVKWNAGDCN